MSRAVITGVGCVTPIGIGMAAFVEGLRAGRSGIGRLTICDPATFNCRVAAEVRDFDPLAFMDLREARTLPRAAQYALAATRLALEHAGITSFRDPRRVGVLIGTSSGTLAYALEQYAIFLERGVRRLHPSSPAYAHNACIASECAIQVGVHGPVMTLSSACTSSTDAIGLGARLIEQGVVDLLLVGGTEAPLISSVFASFDRLCMMPRSYNEVPEQAARPFDSRREGLVLGEGAVMFVLENHDNARRRGQKSLAAVAGYGATCDAYSHFHQKPGGEDAIRAVQEAFAAAGLSPESVDFVSAHGTGTRENDPFETSVLRAVLGSRVSEVPVSASKSQCGHLLGASGAVAAACVVASIIGDFLPATLNLDDPDPECDLFHVRGAARSGRINVALCTSFGFGSRNAALIIQRTDDVYS